MTPNPHSPAHSLRRLEDVEFVQLQSLLQLNSLVSIGKTRDKAKVALVARLIKGNPLRKELLILSLLQLYDGSFISVHDSAFELGQKYLLVFEMLQSFDATGFFLQIFSQSFKECFIQKHGAMQVIVEQNLLSQPETTQLYENALWSLLFVSLSGDWIQLKLNTSKY